MTNETIIAEIIDDETIDGSIELVGVKGEPGIGITTAQAGDSTQNNGYTVTPVTFNKSDGSKTTVDIRSKNGLDGNNGITPTIGENGNWFLEEVDTGKPSRGIQGLPGQDGENGQDGTDGVSITTITSGDPTQNDGFTVTPLTINKSDDSNVTINISAKNGIDGTVSFDNLTEEQKAQLKGEKGNDGLTPIIGANGNWYLDDTDTGKPSRGEQGVQGQPGQDGENGTDGISITTITTGDPTQSDGFTITPLTFNKSDSSNIVVNVSAKNGMDGQDGTNGTDGQDGISPNISVKTNTNDEYVLTITDADGSFDTPNLKGQGGSTGTVDYTELINKPKINNVELNGNKTLNDLGIQQTVVSETQPTDSSVKVWIDPSGDSIVVPEKTSDLINDSGFISSESDPTVPNHVKNITQNNINSWNEKSNFSGSYNDLSNKPDIPSSTSDLTNDSGFITNTVSNLTNYTKTSDLSDVATSGSYNDLSNKPTIPTFSYDSSSGTLTITTGA